MEHRQRCARRDRRYTNNLTDAEWAVVEPLVPPVTRDVGNIPTSGGHMERRRPYSPQRQLCVLYQRRGVFRVGEVVELEDPPSSVTGLALVAQP